MADSNKPIVPGGDTVGTVGEVYLSKNGKTYECVAVIDNTTVTPNGETIPRVEYVWVCTDDGAGGGAFPFDVSDAEPITISRTKEELIAAIDAGKTPIGYWRHTQSNGTVIRLFHFVKRFDVENGTNLTFYFSDKTSSGVLDIKADGTIKRTYQNNDSGGASGSANFTFTITPTNGPGSQMLSATRAEMLAALDSGKTLLGYWTETRTVLGTTDTIKHEFRLESVSGTGADRGLAFVNYEQFYKSTLYVNGNDTVSFVDKEVLPIPTTKTEAMTQSVGMDDDGRLWTEPGASGGGSVQSDWNQNDDTQPDYVKNRPFYTGNPVETVLVEESTVSFAENRGLYMAKIQSNFEVTVGETYKVSWDGTIYECTCVKFNNILIIGNLSIVGEGSDTGEPFIIAVENGPEIQIATADTSASHTFSISIVSSVVKIDAKYLPNTVATKSEMEVAQNTANDAQNTANNAQNTANYAQTTAENAKTTANNAKTTANNAQTTANNAQTTADDAKTTANNAQTTANNAKTTANNAQTTANNAKTTANNAQTTANNAQTTADDAKTTANNAKSEALDLAARMFGHTSVVDNAFYRDETLSITSLPACIESIGDGAFTRCTNLALTSLPSGLTSIGASAFGQCTNLALTSLPSGLTSIGDQAFTRCINLTLTSLPSGLTSIGSYVFSGCTKLALTSLPSGLTSIGFQAFSGCTKLALTSLPSGLTSIGFQAFDDCTNLALTSLPSGLTSIGDGAFADCTNLALTSLPSRLTSIGDSMFIRCTNLALTSLPSGLTSIGSHVFSGCTKLALTSLPSGLTSIGDGAFKSCTGLTSITFTGKPTTIESSAFAECTNLTTINVPWAEGEVANAPWGATNATINYNYTGA